MHKGYKGVLLLLGTSTICVWGFVIFMFFTTQNSPVIVKEHVTSSNVIVEKSEIAFNQLKDSTERVYAVKNKKEYPSPKLGSVRLSNDSGKVSIDALLEMLDVK